MRKPAEAGFLTGLAKGRRCLHSMRLHALRALGGDEGQLPAFLHARLSKVLFPRSGRRNLHHGLIGSGCFWQVTL